jgi:hypothetical protein
VTVQISYFRLLRAKRFKQVTLNWVLDGMDCYYTPDSSLDTARDELILLLGDLMIKECTRFERTRIVESLWTLNNSRQLCDILDSLAGSDLARVWSNSSEDDLGLDLFCKLLSSAKDEDLISSVLSLWSVLTVGSNSREILLRNDESFRMVVASLNTGISTAKPVSPLIFNQLIQLSLGISANAKSSLDIIKRFEFLAVILSVYSSDMIRENTVNIFGTILEILRIEDSNIASFCSIPNHHLHIIRFASNVNNALVERSSALKVLSVCVLRRVRLDGTIKFLKEISLTANMIDPTRGLPLIREFLKALLIEIRESPYASSPGISVVIEIFSFVEHILYYGLGGLEASNTTSDVLAKISFPFDSSPDLARLLCEAIDECLCSKAFEQVLRVI